MSKEFLSQSYHKLPQVDKLLHLSGVPIAYLKKKIEINKFNFSQAAATVNNQLKVVSPDSQKNFAKALLKNPESLASGGLYGIGTFPVEQAEMQLAALLTKTYYEKVYHQGKIPNIKWIDLGHPDWEYLKSSESVSLCVIYGITKDSDQKRIDLARDFYRRADPATVIILALTPNILEFMVDRMGVLPHGVFQLGKVVHRSIS